VKSIHHVFPALILALALPALAPAKTVDLNSKPAEVTVFPRGARVVRTAEADLPQGQHTVSFSDLPVNADPASIRISAEGPKGTKLFGVHTEVANTPAETQERQLDILNKIKDLEIEKGPLADQIAAHQAELDILKNIGHEAASQAEKSASISGLPDAVEKVGKRVAKLLAQVRQDQAKQKEVDAKIDALNRDLRQAGPGQKQEREMQADLELAEAGTVKFSLVYQVTSAGWTPVYDLRLNSTAASPKAAIAFQADVQQQSGEDWDNVKLELSTAKPTELSEIPDPSQWWLDFYQPAPVYRAAKSRSKAYATGGAASSLMAEMAAPEPQAAAPLEKAELDYAETVEAEYSVSFAVHRAADVPSDGSFHRVAIAETSHPASLLLVAVPRLQPAAFIEAEIAYEGKQPLLSGEASLFRDDQFIGKARLQSVAAGDKFKFGFGQDDQVKVKRELMEQKTGEGGLFTKGRRNYHWVTTIKNFHPGERTVEVREQLPRSRQNDILVKALELSPKPLPEDAGKPGLQVWQLKLKPKEERKVVFKYEVKYPEDKRVTGLE
jgi:uncharacterized protein (TIGR02231 family)